MATKPYVPDVATYRTAPIGGVRIAEPDLLGQLERWLGEVRGVKRLTPSQSARLAELSGAFWRAFGDPLDRKHARLGRRLKRLQQARAERDRAERLATFRGFVRAIAEHWNAPVPAVVHATDRAGKNAWVRSDRPMLIHANMDRLIDLWDMAGVAAHEVLHVLHFAGRITVSGGGEAEEAFCYAQGDLARASYVEAMRNRQATLWPSYLSQVSEASASLARGEGGVLIAD